MPAPATRPAITDAPFVAAAFVGSSLVFLVQPIVAKQLLPLLGGAPAVWTTCVLFFQLVLLAGYAWAEFGPRLLGDRRHAVAHAALLGVALCFWPIGVSAGWRPIESRGPILNVLAALASSLALPLTVLSATSPLIQRWHVALRPDRGDRVYRLYAIGNVASLVILLAYPLAIEPASRLGTQRVGLSVAFVVLSLLLARLALARWRLAETSDVALATTDDRPASWREVGAWVGLSAVPSSLLLGVTTFLTTDVAAVPFLWVVPLTLYLGAFSLAFAGRSMPAWLRATVAPGLAIGGMLAVGALRPAGSPFVTIGLRSLAFFLLAWACLSSLYARRPGASRLTSFYLWIAVGGAAGGLFNSIVAPNVFSTAIEYPLVTLIAAAIAIGPPRRDVVRTRNDLAIAEAVVGMLLLTAGVYAASENRVRLEVTAATLAMVWAAPVIVCAAARALPLAALVGGSVLASSVLWLSFGGLPLGEPHRSFFGVSRISVPRPGTDDEKLVTLWHGTTVHGVQRFDPVKRVPIDPDVPLSYYHPDGPFAAIVGAARPRSMAVIGLGGGMIAAYATPERPLTYFEIDPLVIHIADGHPFTYLPAARARGADVRVVEGDARLTVARQDRTFDLIAVDAFSGDSIPTHLLTREAFESYAKRLSPDGALAIHISNRYLDLARVVAAGASAIGFDGRVGEEGTWVITVPRMVGVGGATWVYLTRDRAALGSLPPERWRPLPAFGPRDAWTDDYSDLLHALK